MSRFLIFLVAPIIFFAAEGSPAGPIVSFEFSQPEISVERSPCVPCEPSFDHDEVGTTLEMVSGNWVAIDSLAYMLDPIGDDGVVRGLGLYDTFSHYYAAYDTLGMGVNGFLSFLPDSLPSQAGYRPAPLPCPVQPHAIVAPLWSDLRLGAQGRLYFRSDSTGTIASWHDLEDQEGSGPYTFQVELMLGGAIEFRWDALPGEIPEEVVVGIGDHLGRDGMTWSGQPSLTSALRLSPPEHADGWAVLAGVRPRKVVEAGADFRPTCLVGYAGQDTATTDLTFELRDGVGAVVGNFGGPVSITMEGPGQQWFSASEGESPGSGSYDFTARIDDSVLGSLEGMIEAVAVRETLETLVDYETGPADDVYALWDPGTWAVRFRPTEWADREIMGVGIFFADDLPDYEHQGFEIEILGTGPAGGPGASLSEAVSGSTTGGLTAVALPAGIVAQDTFFVAIRQILPYPDCEMISADGRLNATLHPRHWALFCGEESWESLGDAYLGGDLMVETYFSGPVGLQSPRAPQVRRGPGGVEVSWTPAPSAHSQRVVRRDDAGRLVVVDLGPEIRRWIDVDAGHFAAYRIGSLDEQGQVLLSQETVWRSSPAPPWHLGAPHPSPANPSVRIPLVLENAVSELRIHIVDGAGRKVRTLHNGSIGAGHHEFRWNGRNAIGQSVVSGVYSVRVDDGTIVSQRRMVILR